MYTFYECKAPQCEAEILSKSGVEGRGKATPMNLPPCVNEPNAKEESFIGWRTELEEETLKIGVPFVKLEAKSPPGMMSVGVDCEIAAGTDWHSLPGQPVPVTTAWSSFAASSPRPA